MLWRAGREDAVESRRCEQQGVCRASEATLRLQLNLLPGSHACAGSKPLLRMSRRQSKLRRIQARKAVRLSRSRCWFARVPGLPTRTRFSVDQKQEVRRMLPSNGQTDQEGSYDCTCKRDHGCAFAFACTCREGSQAIPRSQEAVAPPRVDLDQGSLRRWSN